VQGQAARATLKLASTAVSAQSITEIAVGGERFSTLVAAVTAAGLADTLAGPGAFTAYAPVNAAFDTLPEGTVETLLLPENKGQLTNILLYPVDDRVLMGGDFPAGSTYFKPTNEAERLCITSADGGITIADGTGEMAAIIIANLEADNGVISAIWAPRKMHGAFLLQTRQGCAK
jgi:uncharacterized surface protein with fasciclin (FAS1) repeats